MRSLLLFTVICIIYVCLRVSQHHFLVVAIFQRSLISALGEFFKAFLRTVWHCMHLMDGGQILRQNLFRVIKTEEEIRISSQRRM